LRAFSKLILWNRRHFSRSFNNLAALVFYCRLQLIQNILTNGLVPPFTQPKILKIRELETMEKLQLAKTKSNYKK
jgi:hypothetical protein